MPDEPTMRTLGIDYGDRRIGLAISDPEGRLAVPLTTLERRDNRHAVRRIAALAASERVEALVIGEPRGLDGSRGPAAERAVAFGRRLAAATGLPLHTVDEALTSVEAEERLAAAGVDPRQHPERVDSVAAQILLQDALDLGIQPPPSPEALE
ncbi:MAG: Holliday junction resolvase RuvX [Acidobacteriota bacterium]